MDETIRIKNKNFKWTDAIGRHRWKIELGTEDRSNGPFAHFGLDQKEYHTVIAVSLA
jgi:hypothetical protein